MKQRMFCMFGRHEMRSRQFQSDATTDKQMSSSSSYQKPIEHSSHFCRLAIIYSIRSSLCHEAKKDLHLRSTRVAVVSSKVSNNGQTDVFQFFVPKANRALRLLPPSCFLSIQRDLACAMKQRRLCMIGRQEMQSSVSKRCNYWQADEFEFFVPKPIERSGHFRRLDIMY